MAWHVYLNETPLDAIGVWVEDVAERYAGPSRRYPTIALPGRQGVVLAADPEMTPRTVTISGTIDPAARTLPARNTAEDQLKLLAYRGLVKIGADDGETAPRVIDGVCTNCRVTPVVHPMVTQLSRFTVTFLCPDPTWSDVAGSLVSFGSTPSAVPLGSAPSGGVVRIAAPSWSANVVDPTLTYRNAAGVALQSMALTGTLVAGTDYLEIDLDRQTMVQVASGVVANAIAWLTSGAFFALDPMDGDILSASYPQIEVSAASGTPSGVWLGFRRWL